jgi:hypothetical protein
LQSLLFRDEENAWSSEANFSGFLVITVRFEEGIEAVVTRYALQIGLRGMNHWLCPRNWTLFDQVSGFREWALLDEHTHSTIL